MTHGSRTVHWDASVRLREVSRHYALGAHTVRALDRVSLVVPSGEFVAIMGPSGSGKSTLLNLVGGLDSPSAGSLAVGGIELAALGQQALCHYRREQVGIVFQEFNLIPAKSALHNTEFRLVFAGMPRAERLARARLALERVGLDARIDHTPEQLSGGQQQRVAIARALVNDPTVILADEPTGNLDSATGEEILGLLGALARDGRTVLMVTHDDAAARHAHRIIRLRDGRIASGESEPDGVPPAAEESPGPGPGASGPDAEQAATPARRTPAAALRRWLLGD